MTPPRSLIRASHLVLAGFWALILQSAFVIPETTAFYPTLLIALVIVTVARPTAGLLLLSVAVPLAFAIIRFANISVPIAQLVEGMVLACEVADARAGTRGGCGNVHRSMRPLRIEAGRGVQPRAGFSFFSG